MKKTKILIIDDYDVLRKTIVMYLTDLGYQCIEAENGKIGLAHIKEYQPDIILCDLRMPVLDGFGVLRNISSIIKTIPFIVISGDGDIADVIKAHQMGAWDYVIKPIKDFSILNLAIEKVTNKAKLKKENIEYQNNLENLVQSRTKALQKHKEKLEEMVLSRTQELQNSIIELKKTQSQLVQAEKMASLGQLVAGISHEINTPVGIGVTLASNLEARTEMLSKLYFDNNLKKSDLENYLEIAVDSSQMILSNLKRAAELIRSFKLVAVDQSSENKRYFDLGNYIKDVLRSLQNQLKKKSHQIVIHIDEEIFINSYPGTFSQIITNLIQNSLIHGFEEIDYGKITIDLFVEDNSLILIYSDNGKGIPKENLQKIFTPFFTTKRGKGGSGLGLHIIYNLVTTKLHGNIKCETAKNEGIKFKIWIPLGK